LIIITGLPPRLFIHLGILWSDVKCCVYIFFTTGKIEPSSKKYSILLFTSGIFFTDVKPLLLRKICTSDGMVMWLVAVVSILSFAVFFVRKKKATFNQQSPRRGRMKIKHNKI
jgi:hypothetical protein